MTGLPCANPADIVGIAAVTEFIKTLAVEASELTLVHYRRPLVAHFKPDGTPTTAVDLEIETFLLDRIRTRYPDHGILGEEGGGRASHHEFLWVIDPLDGTRAFASGLPIWGISIGVLRDAAPLCRSFRHAGCWRPILG